MSNLENNSDSPTKRKVIGNAPDIWQKYMRGSVPEGTDLLDMDDRRTLLTSDDREIFHCIIKDIINDKILPFIASKVRHFEHAVKNTKKGFTNIMKSFINKKERSENDGLKSDFLMNQAELSMKNLVDLSFVTQDYKTFLSYAKYPIGDFKSIKAYKHLSSCLELQFFSYIISYNNYMDTSEYAKNIFHAANSYIKAKDPKWMIRNLIITAELAKTLDKYEEAAKCYLKLAYTLSSSSVMSALFFEQAAFSYLKISQQRKFSFYLIKAGIIYETLGFKTHGFFCFGIAEPYYTKFKWNEIRNFLYTILSKSSFYFGNLQLSVSFFRNLLQLCCDIDDSENIKNTQKE